MTEIVEETKINTTLSDTKKTILEEKISLNVNRLLVNPACTAGVPTSRPNFSAPMRPDKIVVAAKQLQVVFQTLLPPRVTYRPAKKIR